MEWLTTTLKDLAKKQTDIDKFIHQKYNIEYEKTFNKRIIALFTEISEFINEVRSFKYWSTKKESERQVVLEEYIDCIHFLLSIGNCLKFNWTNYKFKIKPEKDINKLVLDSYNSLSKFYKRQTIKNFNHFLNNFLSILDNKNITKDEFYNAYLIKNNENYNRQQNNY